MSLQSSADRLSGSNKRTRLQSVLSLASIPESTSFQESPGDASIPAGYDQPEIQVSTLATNHKRLRSPDNNPRTPISTPAQPYFTSLPGLPSIGPESILREIPGSVALHGHGKHSLAQPKDVPTLHQPSTLEQPNTFALTSVPPAENATDNTNSNQAQPQPELCTCYECLVLLRRAVFISPSNEGVPHRDLLFHIATHPHLDAFTELPLPRGLLALERFVFEPRWLAPSIVALPDGTLSISPRCLVALLGEYHSARLV